MAVKKKSVASAPALTVPQNMDEANVAMTGYCDAFNSIARLEAEMNTALAQVKADYEALAQPHKASLTTAFKKLEAWASTNRAKLTEEGKTKTVELPAGHVFWRDQPASVKWAKGKKIDDIIEAIKASGMRRFLTLKYSPSKAKMLLEPDQAKLIDGVRIVDGGEKFYVAPFGAEIAEPEDEE
jgi:phage host-nuclease inhibitor protein Gam